MSTPRGGSMPTALNSCCTQQQKQQQVAAAVAAQHVSCINARLAITSVLPEVYTTFTECVASTSIALLQHCEGRLGYAV
jgi:hypothetical protein